MKFLILSLMTLMTTQPVLASQQKVFVSVSVCEGVTESTDGNVNSSMRSLIVSNVSSENSSGKLFINTSEFQVEGETRDLLTVKFVSVDGKTASLRLSNSAGGYATASILNCESPEDVGRIGIMAHYDNR